MMLIAGANVVRFAPALIVSEEEVNAGWIASSWPANAFSQGLIMMVIRPLSAAICRALKLAGDRRRADLAAGR
jgi:hypothetical protein